MIDNKNPRALSAAEQKKVKDMLKAHGYKASEVNSLDVSTNVKKRDVLKQLHHVTDEEYRVVGGSE